MNKYIDKVNQALQTEKAREYLLAVNNPHFNETSSKVFFVQKITRLRDPKKIWPVMNAVDWGIGG